jgi:hypothetical protein
VIPAFLPTAEWMSIQNGQPTSMATFNCTSSLSTGEIVRAEAHTESIQVVASSVGVWCAASVFDLDTRPMRFCNAR